MKTKVLQLILPLFLSVLTASAQNDFSIEWSAYEEGGIVTDVPFNGGFFIENVGTSTIEAGDTVWFGYSIEDSTYDLTLTEGLVSGLVLDEPFEPGAELSVFNMIYWSYEWAGSELNVCATVYGEGYESFTGELFTGDDDISNNKICLTAIVTESVGLSENSDELDVSVHNGEILINNPYALQLERIEIDVFNTSGALLINDLLNLSTGMNSYKIDHLNPGIYIIHLKGDGIKAVRKLLNVE